MRREASRHPGCFQDYIRRTVPQRGDPCGARPLWSSPSPSSLEPQALLTKDTGETRTRKNRLIFSSENLFRGTVTSSQQDLRPREVFVFPSPKLRCRRTTNHSLIARTSPLHELAEYAMYRIICHPLAFGATVIPRSLTNCNHRGFCHAFFWLILGESVGVVSIAWIKPGLW